jgi:hypothetical protein
MGWLLTVGNLVGGNAVVGPEEVGWRLLASHLALLSCLNPPLPQRPHQLHYPVDSILGFRISAYCLHS